MNKIKKHVQEHKELYMGLGGGLAIAGVTYFIVRGVQTQSQKESRAVLQGGADITDSSEDLRSGRVYDQNRGADVYTTKPQAVSFSLDQSTHSTVNNYGSVKRLSYIVSQVGTDNWWRTQAEAARESGISEVNLSKHLNHGVPLPDDMLFVREGVSHS